LLDDSTEYSFDRIFFLCKEKMRTKRQSWSQFLCIVNFVTLQIRKYDIKLEKPVRRFYEVTFEFLSFLKFLYDHRRSQDSFVNFGNCLLSGKVIERILRFFFNKENTCMPNNQLVSRTLFFLIFWFQEGSNFSGERGGSCPLLPLSANAYVCDTNRYQAF